MLDERVSGGCRLERDGKVIESGRWKELIREERGYGKDWEGLGTIGRGNYRKAWKGRGLTATEYSLIVNGWDGATALE